MIKKIDTKAARVRRHARVRKNISGTAERPRLNEVQNIYMLRLLMM